MSEHDPGESTKEVYAVYGLALYFAQVLEHGIVNALLILDLIPSRRHLARSAKDWALEVDTFMDARFERTMGRLIRDLRSTTKVPDDFETLLHTALTRRNWLAHAYFRERATHFMTEAGRDLMRNELEECRALFEQVDERLESIVSPLGEAAGITNASLEEAYRELRAANDQRLATKPSDNC